MATVNDPNYQQHQGIITINQAEATIDVQAYEDVYDGNAHGATGTATGVNDEDLSSRLDLVLVHQRPRRPSQLELRR